MTPAETIIDRFGGIRKAARLLNKPASTVQSWKQSGLIPAKHQRQIMDAAADAGIALQAEDFFERSDRAA